MLDKRGIRQTFRAQLQNAVGMKSLFDAKRIAWENLDFIPPNCDKDDPTNSIWVRETYLKGTELPVSFGYVEENSIIQYDVFVPAGGGTEEAEDLAKAIGDAFHPGIGLTSTGIPGVTAATPSDSSGNPIQISINRCQQLPAASDVSAFGGVWYICPVRITFRAYGMIDQS